MNEKTMPFLQHLEDLRVALTKSIVALGITSIIGWFFKNYARAGYFLAINDGYSGIFVI